MRISRAKLAAWIGACALLYAPGLASAASPDGSYETLIDGNHSLWFGEPDAPNAGEAFCEFFTQRFRFVDHCTLQIFGDGSGRIYGQFDAAVWDDRFLITLAGPVKGSRRGSGETGITRLRYSFKLTGVADDGSETFGVKVRVAFTGQVAPGGVATGAWDERFCIQGMRCERQLIDLQETVLTSGAWRLALEIEAGDGGLLGGSARATFSDDHECDYDLSGRYDARHDLASLALTPDGPECAGTALRLQDFVAQGPGAFSALLRYQMFGLGGTTPVSGPPP